jgi:hypothetical protein
MARQVMPQRDRVGASLLAAIACNSELLVPAGIDIRRGPDKYIPAKIRFERTVAILRVIDGPQLLKLLTLSPLDENRKGKVTEKLLGLAGEKVCSIKWEQKQGGILHGMEKSKN